MADATPSIFLIGYRGSGKSTVGKILARRLGRELVDTDRLAELAVKKSIARCFLEDGEPAFRSFETAALEAVCRRTENGDRLVVATGGGIILSVANRERLRASGAVVWLRAQAAALAARIAADPASAENRPALTVGSSSVDEVDRVLRAREPLYREAATLEVAVEGLSSDEAADRILSHLAGASGGGTAS